jgi:hypothetical protein
MKHPTVFLTFIIKACRMVQRIIRQVVIFVTLLLCVGISTAEPGKWLCNPILLPNLSSFEEDLENVQDLRILSTQVPQKDKNGNVAQVIIAVKAMNMALYYDAEETMLFSPYLPGAVKEIKTDKGTLITTGALKGTAGITYTLSFNPVSFRKNANKDEKKLSYLILSKSSSGGTYTNEVPLENCKQFAANTGEYILPQKSATELKDLIQNSSK